MCDMRGCHVCTLGDLHNVDTLRHPYMQVTTNLPNNTKKLLQMGISSTSVKKEDKRENQCNITSIHNQASK